jgi:hypothetical protein
MTATKTTPPPSHEQELEALIEEARRRARRRRFGYLAVVVALLALAGGVYLGFGGGGGGRPAKDAATPSPLPSAAAHGLRVRLEPGWHAAGQILTPQLLNPRERMSLGTFHMRPGGNCDTGPTRAYADMGPTDGLITIMERPGPVFKYPPRPAKIRLHPESGPFECVPANLDRQTVAFRDHGRVIYAFVALGARGPVQAAQSILNSLRVAPAVR